MRKISLLGIVLLISVISYSMKDTGNINLNNESSITVELVEDNVELLNTMDEKKEGFKSKLKSNNRGINILNLNECVGNLILNKNMEIICVGDSLIYEDQKSSEVSETYNRRLQELFDSYWGGEFINNTNEPSASVTVINRCYAVDEVVDASSRYEVEGNMNSDSKLAIIGYGTNDIDKISKGKFIRSI